MENLHLPEFLAEAFRCNMHHYQCLAVPVIFTLRKHMENIPNEDTTKIGIIWL